MQSLGFDMTENRFSIQFMSKEERTSYVTYSAQVIECYDYNDEQDRYICCMRAELKSIPTLSKWLMLMDVAGIIQLPVVMHAINEHNVLLKDIDYASDEFKKLMSL